MGYYNRNWDELGQNIQDAVDRAINSKNFQKLDQTIRQVVDQAVDQGGQAVRKVAGGVSFSDRIGQQNVKKLYGGIIGKFVKSLLKFIGGGLLSFFSLVCLIGGTISDEPITNYTGVVVFFLLLLATGVWLICSAVGTMLMVDRYKVYRRILGQKTYCSIELLAHNVGKNLVFVRKDLRRMIRKGLFREGYLNREETVLITSHETYLYYEQSRHQLEERQRQETAVKMQKTATTHDPQVQDVLDRGNAFIAQIRKCNDDIPGVEISQKISRIELIVQRIFERVELHPEIVPDLKKLMDYYLPMTVKLLKAYADMDAQPIQGETIQSSKREIEDTLDTLNLAFEKLLDSIFVDTAMDVSSDISVLNTLLAQEGLTEDDFSKIKKQQN